MKRFLNPVSKVNVEGIGLDVHQAVIVSCRLDRRGQPAVCARAWAIGRRDPSRSGPSGKKPRVRLAARRVL